MGSELCKTCIHTKVCMKDKNLVGDVPVMGHPMFFDNDKLYEEYKEREKQGFPCEDYMQTVKLKTGKWIDEQQDRWIYAKCSECLTVHDVRTNFCPNCGSRMEESR